MILQPKEICKHGSTCAKAGSGDHKCFGLMSDRDTVFTCEYYNESTMDDLGVTRSHLNESGDKKILLEGK